MPDNTAAQISSPARVLHDTSRRAAVFPADGETQFLILKS